MDFISAIAVATMINSVALIAILVRVWNQPSARSASVTREDDFDQFADAPILRETLTAPAVDEIIDEARELPAMSSLEANPPKEDTVELNTIATTPMPSEPRQRPPAPASRIETASFLDTPVLEPTISSARRITTPSQSMASNRNAKAMPISITRVARTPVAAEVSRPLPVLVQRVRPRPEPVSTIASGGDYAMAVAKMRRYLDEDPPQERCMASRR